MQGFNFLLRHIPGRMNVTADFLSRMHAADGVVSEQPEHHDMVAFISMYPAEAVEDPELNAFIMYPPEPSPLMEAATYKCLLNQGNLRTP